MEKRMSLKVCLAVGACLCVLGSGTNVNAIPLINSFTFNTPTGATTSGGAVDAKATFDLNVTAGTLTISLENLEADPGNVAQCISAIGFGITGANSANLSSSSGLERTVNSDKTYTDGSTVAAGWALLGTLPNLTLDVLTGTGSVGPEHTIIGGPGAGNTYDQAGGSIANNKPHNPFLAKTVTFTLDVPGATSDSTVDNVFFQFGTLDGSDRVNVPDGGTTALLLGAALSVIGLIRRKLS